MRRPLPNYLLRDERDYTPGVDAYLSCGGGLRHLGDNVATLSFKRLRQAVRSANSSTSSQ